jgi:hypothetical protein
MKEETTSKPRKPYHAPKLHFLGSVRDRTLGSATAGSPDAKATAGRKGA